MKRKCCITGVLLSFLLPLCGFGQDFRMAGHGPMNISSYIKKNSETPAGYDRVTSCSNDSIVLTRQSQVDSFPISNPACTILRKLIIDGNGASPAITRLDSLRYITQVTEEFKISNTDATSLSAFTGLTTLGGYVWFESNYLMTSLGLPAAVNMNQVTLLFLIGLPELTDISYFRNKVRDNQLEQIVVYNTGLTNLAGLDSIHHTDFLNISGNYHLQSLHGMEGLSTVGYYFTIGYNDSLTSLAALSNLDSMIYSGYIECRYNQMLTNLAGLSNLTYMEGGLWIQGNNNLTTLNDLNPSLFIHDYGGDSVRITDNPQLAICGSPPICNYINNSTTAHIENNAPGCNSIAEVQAACVVACTGGVLKTWNGSTSYNWNDSANWTPGGVPGICDSVLITDLPNYPTAGTDITISGFRMTRGSHLDMNGFNFTDNGNITLDSASIGSGEEFNIHAPFNPHIDSCTIFAHHLVITNFTGGLHYFNTYILGDVNISDAASRSAPADIAGNFFNGNLVVTANSTDTAAAINISYSQGDAITGNETLNINSPTHVTVGGPYFQYLTGDLVINSNFAGYPSLRSVEFNNYSAPSHITRTGTAPVHINLARISGGDLLVPDQDVYIDSFFHFAFGRVKTVSDKLLIFGINTNISVNVNGTSFVWGPVKKIGNNGFYFPVGDSIYNGACSMSAPSQVTDTFTAQYFHRNPSQAGYDTSQHVSSLSKILSKEYWTINRNNGNSNVQLSFSYDTARGGPIPSIYDLRVAGWNGSQWQNLGNAGVTGNAASGTVLSGGPVSSFGPFALALAPHRIPVITIANADSVGCAGSSLNIHFTLDTLMLSNNVFTAQLSDSSGSFSNPTVIGTITSNHSDSINAFVTGNIPEGDHYKIRIVGNSPPDTSVAKNVTIKPFPSPSIVVHGPAVACYGGGIYKYWVTPAQPGIIYNWNINQGDTITSNYDTAYVRFGYVGSHSVSVINANVCRTGTLAYLGVNVSYPAPTASPVLTNTGRWLFSTAPAANQYALGYHWYRNDTLISGATNNSYYASAAGSYKVKYYNLCNEGPASNTISFAATSLPQTINFPAIPNKTYGDPDFEIPATASSGLPVSFSITSGPGSIPGNIYHITTTGTATIRATQPGDNVYDTAVPVSRTFTINKAAQTITFPAISDKDLATTTQFTLNATSSSGLLISYNILSGPASVSGSTVTLTGLGTVTIRATQPGDTNYLAATVVDRSFCVRVSALNPISGPAIICPTINVTYTVNNIPGAVYTWRIAGGSTLPSTTNMVTLIWPSPGTYTLIASAVGSCGAASGNDSLTITAITSVQPDSVHSMLPANGAINQQLPLTLSWIPANPNLFYTYDLYVWRADTAQPSAPYVSGLTTFTYTIPLNSGLPYGQTYKWMIAAHNGSCTVVNGGPIQTFSLIPLPDLEVYNVNAPSTALSGQPISVTWKVKNNGPGNTQLNQHWTDAVFISVDSVLNFSNPNQVIFPAAPLLVATKPNVTALNAGQLYNDTATFTTPVTYSGPLYMHVVTNYAPPANNPVLEITKLNDTAHALPPTAVTLSPQPDLRVDTIVNPNNTFSGSTINITYKVKNFNVNANGFWIDKVYISKDAVFNINTATLLKYPNSYGNYYPANDVAVGHSNGLQQDSSYTVSIQAVVPNFIYGGYYVYVFANANGDLYEGPNNNNNINHGNLLQVFLTATPKLTPLTVSVVPNISITQLVPVNWPEQNQGAYDNLERSRGHYFVSLPYSCPFNRPSYRDSLGFGSSYWIDRVYLSTDSTGLIIPNSTLLGEVPHGSPNSYSGVGPYPEQYCAISTPANENTATAILPNSNNPAVYGYQVPSNLSQGDYYIYVYANPTKTVYEYPGTPQIVRSNKITVSWPDLTVPSVTVPTTGNSGQPFTINYTILNAGPGAVYNHYRKDYIYMGNSNTFNGSAVLLDSVIYNSASVPVNISQSLQKVITLPNGVSGSKFIFIRTNGDSTFKETNLNNNTNTTGAPVTISLTPPPDLQVSSIVMSDTVFSALGFPFKYTVTNTGSGLASGAWKDSIFISCSNIFNSSTAYFAGVRTQQNYIPASSNYSDSFTLYLPLTFVIQNSGCLANDTAHAYFFVKTNANNGLYEPVTNNNTGVTNQKTIINALVDHIITNVTSADSAWVGQYFKTRWTVKNLGYAPEYYSYYIWSDHVFVTTDSVLTANPRLIGFNGQEMQRLGHNQTYTDSISGLMPNMPSGYYYLFVNTNTLNQIVAEHNLTNNPGLRRNASGQPIRIYVTNNPLADLTDSITSAPLTIAVGQPVKIIYQVKNTGVNTTITNSWSDDIWLSNSLQLGGLYLGSKNHFGALATGQSYIDSFIVYIPINQVQGNYVIVVRANSSISFYENNYNNNLAFRYMSVYTPAPTDLVVDSVGAADTLILGKSTFINWNLRNISNNPANGFETDGIYLGSDSLTNSNNDILIGTKQNQLNILPLASAAKNAVPTVSGVTEGSYFLKVKTDILNNILETNKLNNTGIRSSRVYVKVKVLPMNISTPDTLSPSYLYYKLVVPAALNGKTIQVKLTSNDSLTATNQMYIGLGYLPSAAHFDYTYSAPNYGNQQIVIESVVDSVYYIAAKGTKPSAAYQLVSLKAVELPFAITTVNANRGGNTGNVTVQIKGSLFTNNMIARIHGVSLNNNISASAIYFINSTTVYATFNLSGKPLGIYDVILKKPDSSAATLPSGFTIELTNNGGLITGSGPNTGQIGSGNAPACDPGASSGLNSQLQTELIIPPKVFASWPFVIQINYTNTTNVDIPAQVKILYSLDGAPLSLTEAGLSEGKTNLYLEFKDSIGPPNTIRAGGTGTVRIYSKAPLSATAHSFLNYTFQ